MGARSKVRAAATATAAATSVAMVGEWRRAAVAYPRNWCGSTKMSSVEPVHACVRSGSAMTLGVNLMPCASTKLVRLSDGRRAAGLYALRPGVCGRRTGRYLTFSCCVLIISVRFLPLTCSWNTHMRTSSSNSSDVSTLRPTILAIAEPQLPEPTMVTFSFAFCRCKTHAGISRKEVRAVRRCLLLDPGTAFRSRGVAAHPAAQA